MRSQLLIRDIPEGDISSFDDFLTHFDEERVISIKERAVVYRLIISEKERISSETPLITELIELEIISDPQVEQIAMHYLKEFIQTAGEISEDETAAEKAQEYKTELIRLNNLQKSLVIDF